MSTTFVLRNCHTEALALGQNVHRFGQRMGLSPRQINALNLALEEIFTNIVSYAYPAGGEHKISFHLIGSAGRIRMRIEDDGIAFDPLSAPPVELACQLDDEKVGGLGIYLARQLVDHMTYKRIGERNILTMTIEVGAHPKAS